MPNTHTVRVRYSDVDALGTYYNSRALEWFECGRTELCRDTGTPYTEWEQRGVLLPVTEAYVKYLGKATYDCLLKITTAAVMTGRARVRFDVNIERADTGQPVCRGYTVHAITDAAGKPIRPPQWVVKLLNQV
jgi:acyl-CoA thioester hydrolase